MKINEVPQDKEDFKGKSNLHKLVYATQEDGRYTSVNSEGWEVENLATKQAWEAAQEQIEQVKVEVNKGIMSPIAYYMHKNLMDVAVLARYVHKWKWQVKRHFKPKVFKKLSQNTLERYGNVFNISVAELQSLPIK